MTDLLPGDGERCDVCGAPVDEEDGYVIATASGAHRYCDGCPRAVEFNT